MEKTVPIGEDSDMEFVDFELVNLRSQWEGKRT